MDFELTAAQKDVLDRIDKFIKDDSKDCDKLLTLSGVAGTVSKSIPKSVGAVHKLALPVVPTKSIKTSFSFPG